MTQGSQQDQEIQVGDLRISGIQLDETTIIRRNADIEQERRVAIFDLLEGNFFQPLVGHSDGYAGPFRLRLSVQEGRLALDVRRDDDTELALIILSMGRFRRLIREYFAICDSYYQAVRAATADQIEAVDMARRGLHNQAAELLIEALQGKATLDFDTARRLFTLICVLHIKG